MPVTQICPYLRIQYKYIGYNRPHPLYCPQFLQCQHKIGQISCPVEGGARILEVRILEVRLYLYIVYYNYLIIELHAFSLHAIASLHKHTLRGDKGGSKGGSGEFFFLLYSCFLHKAGPSLPA